MHAGALSADIARALNADHPRPSRAAVGAAAAGQVAFQISKAAAALRHQRGVVTPIIWFLLDWLVLGVAIASLLVVDSWWVKIFASLVAALWIARLFVIGHDACHGSYTPNKTLNKWIGRIAFLPSLTPYSLWEIGHNLAHHGFTNLKGRDYVWTPVLAVRIREAVMDPPPAGTHLPQRLRPGRLLHDRNVVEEAILSRAQACRPRRRISYTWDSLLVTGFGILWVGGLVLWGVYSGRSIWSLLIFGFAVPFFVWNCLMGFVIYVQHTHPRVAWYERRDSGPRMPAMRPPPCTSSSCGRSTA